MPDWLIATGLIVLTIVPGIGGAVRLSQIAGGAEVTIENARFLASPIPVVLHIVGSLFYCLLGAFQFLPGFRRRNIRWHRTAGKILLPVGLLAAATGLWMTLFYPWPELDGATLYVIRLLAGSAMFVSLCLGYVTVRRRDHAGHRAWMMRAYALGIAAGTQVFTHLPIMIAPGLKNELTRTICMAAGWGINLGVVEWLIVRERRGRRGAGAARRG